MALSDVEVRDAAGRIKSYRLYDGEGLYLEVSSSGRKKWYFQLRVEGRHRRCSLGAYPGTDLLDARLKRDELLDSYRLGGGGVYGNR